MKKGLMILAHGSKVPETDRIMNRYVEAIKEKAIFDQVEKAYLQMMDPDIEMSAKKFHDNGVSDILIFPLFLFNGNHIKEDIPQKMEEIKLLYPEMMFTFLDHIGFDEKLVQLILERVAK